MVDSDLADYKVSDDRSKPKIMDIDQDRSGTAGYWRRWHQRRSFRRIGFQNERFRELRSLPLALLGVCFVLASCAGTSSTEPSAVANENTQQTQETRRAPKGGPVILHEAIPEFTFQPEGRYEVAAGTIVEEEIDGVTALRALFSVYPPDGVKLEPDVENPAHITDGEERVIGSCTYRLDINEADNTVTMVPVKEPSPNACGSR